LFIDLSREAMPSVSSDSALLGLMQATGEVVYRWDAADDRIEWSDNASIALNLPVSALPRRRDQFDGRIGPDDVPARRLAITACDAGAPCFRSRFKFRGFDGSHLWFEENGAVLFGDHGAPVGILGRLVPAAADLSGGYLLDDPLISALNDGRLAFDLQPIVDGVGGEARIYECLARMSDGSGSVIPAGDFIPAAEQVGVVRELDLWSVQVALNLLEKYPAVDLSVNVSGLTATDPVVLERMMPLLASRHDLAGRLIVEITETVAMRDLAQTERFISTLRAFGCRIAIDDFGSGYTSFHGLRALDVDIVKIDGSFVRNLDRDPDNRLFVDALVRLAHGIGAEIVAECVENKADAAILRRYGVEYLQGHLFGRPLPETASPLAVRAAANS
jgi:EAL domain-containing protein (putative c-di-GMP-specific phosphodiesterase class I)